jgi:hypothetical protein
MAPMNAGQLRTRARVEGVIRLMAPFLDTVLAVGERVSKIVEPEDTEYYPPRMTTRPEGGDGRRPEPNG